MMFTFTVTLTGCQESVRPPENPIDILRPYHHTLSAPHSHIKYLQKSGRDQLGPHECVFRLMILNLRLTITSPIKRFSLSHQLSPNATKGNQLVFNACF